MEMEIPKPVKNVYEEVKRRAKRIIEQYGSVQVYGNPVYQSKEEVCVIYWLWKQGKPYTEIARELGLDKTALYRLMRRVEAGKVTVYSDGKQIQLTISPEECMDIVDELIRPKARHDIKSIMESAVIRAWLDNPRKLVRKHSSTYNEAQIKRTLSLVARIHNYIKAKHPDLPSNPDYWTEDMIGRILDEMVPDPKRKRRYKQLLKRIWRDWFKGEIGRVLRYITPKETVLYYADYLKIKELVKSGEIPKWWWILTGLHIWSGAREGYSNASSLENATSSLVGIKWSKALWDRDMITGFNIFENKTLKDWSLRYCWLDKELCRELTRLYRKYHKKTDSVVRSILLEGGIDTDSVEIFRKTYRQILREISNKLGLPYKLTPHDMRRSHISILAELEVPLEMAVTDQGFGVGWEDLTTAVVFYLRFSKRKMERVLAQVEQIKAEYH